MGKNQSASNITNIIKQDANGGITFMSGSTTLMAIGSSGAITTTGTISGSDAANAVSASYALTSTTATTASYADNLLVKGAITAQTLVVQTITSSVDFVTGSTKFGSIGSNTHVFTGSMSVSGSLTVNGNTTSQNIYVPAVGGEIMTAGSSNGLFIGGTGLDYTTLKTTGTERIRITSGGAVGIGTSSPSKRLEVYEDNSSTSNITGLKITNWSGTTDTRAGIVFQNYDNNGAAIWSRRTGSTPGDLIFGTNGGGGIAESNISEKMRITSAGNVGIGTSTPSANGLTIYRDGGDRKIMLELNRPNTAGLQSAIQFTVGNSIMVGQIQHEYAGSNLNHMSFSLRNPGGGNFVALWLQNDGNIGVGTTVPYTKLHVNGSIGMNINSAGYPINAKLVKQSTNTVTFTVNVGILGAWRPGYATIRVAAAQNGLQEYTAAWYFIRIVTYFAAGANISVVSSGGDTGSYTFSSSGTSSGSPQILTFTIADANASTDTIIADIDFSYTEGIVSIS